MSGLTTARNTTKYGSSGQRQVLPVEGSTIIQAGSMVAIDAFGNAVPAQPLGDAPLNALKIAGMMRAVVNGFPGSVAANIPDGMGTIQTGNGSNLAIGTPGAISIEVELGVFFYDNYGDITEENQGQLCFATDDHTVSISDNGGINPCAGRIIAVADPGFPNQVAVDHFDRAATATTEGT